MKQEGLPFVVKRALDVGVAATVLVVGAPLIAAVGVAVRVRLGSPVLFCQPRAGRAGRPFLLYKFRTMGPPAPGEEGPDHDWKRIPPLGAFLRSSSLDELPQLVNVLRGEMSLVGPRPLLLEYVPRYDARQRRRLDALPGITGWAQVRGRNALSWSERFELDVWYVEHWTPWLDLGILVRTLDAVIGRRGIASEGHASMPEFMGEGGGAPR